MKIENPYVCLLYAVFLTSLFSETSGFEKTGCSEQQAVFFPEAGRRALNVCGEIAVDQFISRQQHNSSPSPHVNM